MNGFSVCAFAALAVALINAHPQQSQPPQQPSGGTGKTEGKVGGGFGFSGNVGGQVGGSGQPGGSGGATGNAQFGFDANAGAGFLRKSAELNNKKGANCGRGGRSSTTTAATTTTTAAAT